MTTLSIIQDYLKTDEVPLALSVTNEKLKQLGLKQTQEMIMQPITTIIPPPVK